MPGTVILISVFTTLFAANGLILYLLQTRMVPKVDQIKLQSSESDSTFSRLDKLTDRLEKDIERLTKERDAALAEVAKLKGGK